MAAYVTILKKLKSRTFYNRALPKSNLKSGLLAWWRSSFKTKFKILKLFQSYFQNNLPKYIPIIFCKTFLVGLLPVCNTLDKNLLNVSNKQSFKGMRTEETYLEPSQKPKMEHFVKIVNSL